MAGGGEADAGTDDDLLVFVQNIYAVLLTRGIMGTYLYVCDPELRAYLRPLVRETQDSETWLGRRIRADRSWAVSMATTDKEDKA